MEDLMKKIFEQIGKIENDVSVLKLNREEDSRKIRDLEDKDALDKLNSKFAELSTEVKGIKQDILKTKQKTDQALNNAAINRIDISDIDLNKLTGIVERLEKLDAKIEIALDGWAVNRLDIKELRESK